jgi:hypothetical protein
MGEQCGAIGNILGNTLRTQRIPWKLDGNTLGRKEGPSPHPPKEKNGTSFAYIEAFSFVACNSYF